MNDGGWTRHSPRRYAHTLTTLIPLSDIPKIGPQCGAQNWERTRPHATQAGARAHGRPTDGLGPSRDSRRFVVTGAADASATRLQRSPIRRATFV